jgi:cobalt-zinc-cadmium efflux system outer membrane protein
MVLIRPLLVLFLLTAYVYSDTWTFESVVNHFLTHNYDLKIAQYEIDKSKADLLEAQRRPNPILYGSYSFLDANHRFGDQAKGSPAFVVAHLDHPIELGGKRDQRIKTANETITYTRLLVEENKRQALISLLNAYYQVQTDQAHYHNALNNRRDFDKLLTIAHHKYARGLIDDVDLEELKLQLLSYDKEIDVTQTALLADTETLALMLSLRAEELNIPEISFTHPPMEHSLDHLITHAQTHRADCLAAIHNVILAEASIALEKANAIPDITLGIESEQYAPNYDNPLIGVSAAFPLPLYNHNQGAIERAKVTVLQARAQQTKILAQTAVEIRSAFLFYQSQQKVYATTKEEFNAISRLKTKHLAIFEHKGLSILDLLDNLRRYHDYQRNLIRASADLMIAQEYLKLMAGMPLIHPKE